MNVVSVLLSAVKKYQSQFQSFLNVRSTAKRYLYGITQNFSDGQTKQSQSKNESRVWACTGLGSKRSPLLRFCVPNNKEFERAFRTSTAPYVFMQPVDDFEAGHDLAGAILRHRVAAILLGLGLCLDVLPASMEQLEEDFAGMKDNLWRWAWPRTSDTNHLSSATEVRNRASYSPANVFSRDGEEEDRGVAVVPAIWRSFMTNLGDAPEGSSAAAATAAIPDEKRLRAFRSIAESDDSSFNDFFPRFECLLANKKPYDETSSSSSLSSLSHSEATWRELLLGEEEEEGGGLWRRAIDPRYRVSYTGRHRHDEGSRQHDLFSARDSGIFTSSGRI